MKTSTCASECERAIEHCSSSTVQSPYLIVFSITWCGFFYEMVAETHSRTNYVGALWKSKFDDSEKIESTRARHFFVYDFLGARTSAWSIQWQLDCIMRLKNAKCGEKHEISETDPQRNAKAVNEIENRKKWIKMYESKWERPHNWNHK